MIKWVCVISQRRAGIGRARLERSKHGTPGVRTMSRDLSGIALASARVALRSFTAADAAEAFAAATPTLTRFMGWDPSPSPAAFAEVWRLWLSQMAAGTDVMFAARLRSSGEFLGMVGLHRLGGREPEIGVWIKQAAQGFGYGREAVTTAIGWASSELGAIGFIYPVVKENRPSRRLAESLGGRLVGTRPLAKASGMILDQVIYWVPSR